MKQFLSKDMYMNDSPDLEFLQNDIKDYLENKDESLYVDFLSNFDQDTYIRYIQEAMSSIEFLKEEELNDDKSFCYFDFWMNSAIDVFTKTLWQSTYDTTRGNDIVKTQTANHEVEEFKEFVDLYTIEKNIEEGYIQTLH